MTKRQAPPGRRSNSWKVFVKPLGPHHRASRCRSLNAENTSSRRALRTREVTISRSDARSASTRSVNSRLPGYEDRVTRSGCPYPPCAPQLTNVDLLHLKHRQQVLWNLCESGSLIISISVRGTICHETPYLSLSQRVVDINAFRALAPLPRAPVPRPSRPQPRTPHPRWSRRHSDRALIRWIRTVAPRCRRVCSVCVGSLLSVSIRRTNSSSKELSWFGLVS